MCKCFLENITGFMSRQNVAANNEMCKLYVAANSTVRVPSKIICAEGIKQVGTVTSGHRGSNVTIIAPVSAIGNHYRPVLLLPIVHFKNHMLTGAQFELQTQQVGQTRGSALTV